MSGHSAGWKSRYARGNRVSLKNEAGNVKVNVTVVHQEKTVTKVSRERRERGKVRQQGGRQVCFQALKWLKINDPHVLKVKCVISQPQRTAKNNEFFSLPNTPLFCHWSDSQIVPPKINFTGWANVAVVGRIGMLKQTARFWKSHRDSVYIFGTN